MKASIEVFGDGNFRQFHKRLNNIMKTTVSKKVLTDIAALELKAIRQRFTSNKSSPSGVKWAPWKPKTRAGRVRRRTVSGGLLRESGNLMNSIRSKVTRRTITIGTKVRHAGYLQFGTENMVARPFLGWNKSSASRIVKRIRAEIRKKK